jgi:16S rRNA A1518/A1519 N6-dimethyltransferase RsmA/KsgA/DIM1 with predicted DNA glycosylase/AP lyase activity
MLKNKLAIFFPSFSGMIRIIDDFADVDEGDLVYDLGSGDGRVLEHFGKKNIKCVGVEQNPLLNKIARKKLKEYSNVKIIQGNIFDQDLSKATVIIAYLSRLVTKDLQKKIKKECNPRTKIILVSYKFSDWNPIKMKRWLWLPIRLYEI